MTPTLLNLFDVPFDSSGVFIVSAGYESGFILPEEKAIELINANSKNSDVVEPYINGEDLNSRYDQTASRWVINFFDRPLNSQQAPEDYKGNFAEDYPDCLKIVTDLVKPVRMRLKEDGSFALRNPLPQKWWQHADKRPALYSALKGKQRTLVVAQVSKTLAFSYVSTNQVLDSMLTVIPLEKYRYLVIMQSCIHFYWAWKYCTTMKGDLRYTPTAIFETFPFPAGFEPNREYVPEEILAIEDADETIKQHKATLDTLGEKLDNQRKAIMLKIRIGLTNLYNLYHQENLSAASIAKTAKCSEADADWALGEFMKMRQVQVECDNAVAAAYGWSDIVLNHGFYDLEFLPENDRRRYTVCPDARKEIMTRLLKLNNDRHKQEVAAGLVDDTGKLLKKSPTPKPKKKKATTTDQIELL